MDRERLSRPVAASAFASTIALAATIALAVAVVVGFTARDGGQQEGPAQPAQRSSGTPAVKPLVPVAANTLSARPDAYYGARVTITAAVDRILSPTAFLIAQRSVGDRTTGTAPGAEATGGPPTRPVAQPGPSDVADVLIVAPTLTSAVEPNAYVTVLGEVVRFDPAELARTVKGYSLNASPDIVDKYRGRPAIVASSVFNAARVDLAKKPLPPMTADDRALSAVMKRVGPAFAALRGGVDQSSAAEAAQQSGVLKKAFAETEAFWKSRNRTDATSWAREAQKQVDSIGRDAAGGQWEAVKASTASLGKTCQSCHTTYRERMEDGTYRIKAIEN